jgi:hypothetical protein
MKVLIMLVCAALPSSAAAQTGNDLFKLCLGSVQEKISCELYVAGFCMVSKLRRICLAKSAYRLNHYLERKRSASIWSFCLMWL